MTERWRPAVSVVTPTMRRRLSQLARCTQAVWAQDYWSQDFWWFTPERIRAGALGRDGEHVVELDDPPSGDWGVGARLRALARAKGEVIAYLDDDNAWRRDHLERLAPLLKDAAFAYSRMLQHGRNGYQAEVGEWPPRLGGLDTSCIVHRRELLEVATWEPAGYASDWDLVRRWVEAGARGAFLDAITVDYYEDAR